MKRLLALTLLLSVGCTSPGSLDRVEIADNWRTVRHGTGGGLAFKQAFESVTNGVASPRVLTIAESGKVFDNTGATELVYLELPPAEIGVNYWLHVEDDDGLRLVAVGDDIIEFAGVHTGAAGNLTSTTHGSGITITAFTTSEWVATVMPAGSREAWSVDSTPTGFGARATYFFSTPAATSITAGTEIKAAGTTTAGPVSSAWTHSGANRLTYAGLNTLDFVVTITVGMSRAGGGGALLASVILAENGAEITGAFVDSEMSDSSDEGAFPLTFVVTASTGDFYEIWLDSDLTKAITIESGGMTISSTSGN